MILGGLSLSQLHRQEGGHFQPDLGGQYHQILQYRPFISHSVNNLAFKKKEPSTPLSLFTIFLHPQSRKALPK